MNTDKSINIKFNVVSDPKLKKEIGTLRGILAPLMCECEEPIETDIVKDTVFHNGELVGHHGCVCGRCGKYYSIDE